VPTSSLTGGIATRMEQDRCFHPFAIRRDVLRLERSSCSALGLEIHAAEQVLEARVRTKRIENWLHFNTPCSERAVFITLF